MTNHKKGYLRGSRIVKSVTDMNCLNADQLRIMHLRDISNVMACRVLTNLTEGKGKRLNRDRFSANEPYFYYVGKRPGLIKHTLGVNWIYLWLKLNLESWERIHSFETEIVYKTLRADGFLAIKNVWTNKFNFMFIEFDVYESGNKFEKGKLYDTLYETDGYLNSWWVPLAERFPPVVVVTTGNTKKIKERVGDSKVEFRVYSFEEIKEECINGSSSRASIRS